MIATIKTVSFQGVDVLDVDVQVQLASGMPAFSIVGLPDKAVAESRERVRAALHALGISLPAKRLTINLAPADLAKEGSHFDLPIALGVLAVMDVIPAEEMSKYIALGELSLDASLRAVNGVLPAALHAVEQDAGLIVPYACGGEAAWAGDLELLAPKNLLQLINHIKGTQVLVKPQAKLKERKNIRRPDLSEVKGQETAKRALEVAAAGGHNMLMVGPPGSGKSMLSSCLPSILPALSPKEALEVSMIHSLAGSLPEGGLLSERPFRDPHHSASLPSLVGGGHKAKPGEISLAHNGVLFLDEFPEFQRSTLEALRQPVETGTVLVSRVNYHVKYPARFQLIAAMNPCRCGYLGDPDLECTKAPRCGGDYQNKISGPMFDRIDLTVDVPAVQVADLQSTTPSETSKIVAERVLKARMIQSARYKALGADYEINAYANGEILEKVAPMDDVAKAFMAIATDKMRLSARAYHRVLRLARTIADLEGNQTQPTEILSKKHLAEALSYRRPSLRD
ncbi:MAG: YifB family Mg chelatase-like AAA ATPase [Alphaproteobacteria bacterium]|nr:YifB family Mg chelatase-like AAA ATPase [Alphaproteobacteria bacterium]